MSDYGQGGDNGGNEAAFHALVGKALVDHEFRDQLRGGGIDEALISIGIEPTPEIKEALGAAMGNVDSLAEAFGGVKAAT